MDAACRIESVVHGPQFPTLRTERQKYVSKDVAERSSSKFPNALADAAWRGWHLDENCESLPVAHLETFTFVQMC